jgi:hypothetical protein
MIWRSKGQPMKPPAAGDDQQDAVFAAVDDAEWRIHSHAAARNGEAALLGFLG